MFFSAFFLLLAVLLFYFARLCFFSLFRAFTHPNLHFGILLLIASSLGAIFSCFNRATYTKVSVRYKYISKTQAFNVLKCTFIFIMEEIGLFHYLNIDGIQKSAANV